MKKILSDYKVVCLGLLGLPLIGLIEGKIIMSIWSHSEYDGKFGFLFNSIEYLHILYVGTLLLISMLLICYLALKKDKKLITIKNVKILLAVVFLLIFVIEILWWFHI